MRLVIAGLVLLFAAPAFAEKVTDDDWTLKHKASQSTSFTLEKESTVHIEVRGVKNANKLSVQLAPDDDSPEQAKAYKRDKKLPAGKHTLTVTNGNMLETATVHVTVSTGKDAKDAEAAAP